MLCPLVVWCNARAPKLKVPPKIINVRNYKRFNLEGFQSDVKTIPMEHIKLVLKDANEVWIGCKAFFLDILDKHAPVTRIKVKGNNLPYVTSELETLSRTRDYQRAKANETGSVCLRKAFNHVKNRVNKTLSDLQRSYYAQKLKRLKEPGRSINR